MGKDKKTGRCGRKVERNKVLPAKVSLLWRSKVPSEQNND